MWREEIVMNLKYLLLLSFCLTLCSCSIIQAPYTKVKVWNERREVRNLQESEAEPKYFDGELEPRMPSNWANDSTLAGIDANNNGVRDDVEIWINRRWDNSNLRKGFKQLATSVQKVILSSDLSDSELKDVYTNSYSRSLRCIRELTKKQSAKYVWDEIELLEDIMAYSSWARMYQWNKNIDRSLQLGSRVFNDSSVDACLF